MMCNFFWVTLSKIWSYILKKLLTLTEAGPETDSNKLASVPNGISVLVQYEHLHTILYKQFFIGLCRCVQTMTVVMCDQTMSNNLAIHVSWAEVKHFNTLWMVIAFLLNIFVSYTVVTAWRPFL